MRAILTKLGILTTEKKWKSEQLPGKSKTSTSTSDTSTSSSKWDIRYLALAEQISKWSKDPSRQIGAVAVGSKGQVLAQGYNGFPRGIDDSLTTYYDREKKYQRVVHAEMNVIFNATYNGVSLDRATLYVHGLPVCSECAKGIIQVGIKKVVMPAQDIPDHWKDSWELTKTFFEQAGVRYEFV
jgi:dCMP deaminase